MCQHPQIPQDAKSPEQSPPGPLSHFFQPNPLLPVLRSQVDGKQSVVYLKAPAQLVMRHGTTASSLPPPVHNQHLFIC